MSDTDYRSLPVLKFCDGKSRLFFTRISAMVLESPFSLEISWFIEDNIICLPASMCSCLKLDVSLRVSRIGGWGT